MMFSRQAYLRTAWAAIPSRVLAPQVRFYATPATETVKPPVTLFGVDGTYATALYSAAVKNSSLETTANALTKLGSLVSTDSKLASILEAPSLSPAEKSAIVAELEKNAGPNAVGETVKNFLQTLAENNRLGILGGVCTKFGELISAARGEVEMIVTSAAPLDNRTLTRLETAVSKSPYVGQGKKLTVINVVKPEIKGGLIVGIGDRTIDLSVSSKIAKMNKLLTDTL